MRFRIRLIFFASCALFSFYLLYYYFSENDDDDQPIRRKIAKSERIERSPERNDEESEESDRNRQEIPVEKDDGVDFNVHAFYYPWFGNPTFDNGSYYHWNHNILPGPGQSIVSTKRYEPPDEIGSNFYPELGCYSSRDPDVIKKHFEWLREAGVGTVVVSWYPPGQSTDQGHPWDDLMPALLDAAQNERLKIAFHIEPYKNRNVENFRENVAYIINSYGSHPAFYRYRRRPGAKSKPLFYVYDSYTIADAEWRTLLRRGGRTSIRDTPLDSHFIGLLVTDHHKTTLSSSGFDGFYTYFAATEFSYGSTWRNWKKLSHAARRSDMIFIPCVGPGYIDVSVRPWNEKNTFNRGVNGDYYGRAWTAAIGSRPDIVGVTSFNEWHEGTQIEPAVSHTSSVRTYLDYDPLGSKYYLELTLTWVKKFTDLSTERRNET